jgi:hypothetical protein
MFGSQVNVNSGAYTGDVATFTGKLDNAFMTNGTVDVGSSASSVTVYGTGVTAADALGVTGGMVGFESNGDFANLANGQINTDFNGQTITVEGANDTTQCGAWTGDIATLAANMTDYVYGNHEDITGASGDRIATFPAATGSGPPPPGPRLPCRLALDNRNRLSPAVAGIARNGQALALPPSLRRTFPAHFLHRRNGHLFSPTKSNGWKSEVLSPG